MGAIATVLRLSGRTLRHAAYLALLALRGPISLILRLLGRGLLVGTPFVAAVCYGAGWMEATSPTRGLSIATIVAAPAVGFLFLFMADGYDRLLTALAPEGTVLILPV